MFIYSAIEKFQATYGFLHSYQPFHCRNLYAPFSIPTNMNWNPKSAPKLDFSEDLYSVLEVPPNVEKNTLKKNYYKLVFKYHPDGKRTDEERELANRQMMVINNAYKILKNDKTREQYDLKRQTGINSSRLKSDSQENGNKRSSDNSQKSSVKYNSDKVYNDIFSKYRDENLGQEEVTNTGPTESLADIISELWREVATDGGKHVMSDFIEFLEGSSSTVPNSTNSAQVQSRNVSPKLLRPISITSFNVLKASVTCICC